MKGVILAGGHGTRLHPLTKVTNKCLLPVYNKPMIYYPIETLVNSGVEDVLLVCGGNSAGEFLRILGNGSDLGLKNNLHYTYQKEANGIADALSLAEQFVDGDSMCVILADNILQNPFPDAIEEFKENPDGATVFLTEVENPEWYGVATVEDGRVTEIEEKPKEPKSNLAVIGVYIYDSSVWEYIKRLSPSARGELEITDVNNHYLASNKLKAKHVDGWWKDAGESIDCYLDTCIKVRSLAGD